MRRTPRPRPAARASAVMALAALCLAAPTSAQAPLPVLQPADAPAAQPPSARFTIPEQRDARDQLRAILDYLGRTSVPWDVVTGTAQRLLDAKSDSFYRLRDAKGDETGSVVSVRAKVNQILGELPPAGRQFYEQEYGGAASKLLKQALDAGYDRAQLSALSQRYFHTKAGMQATLLLANLDLETGRADEAAYSYSRLLSRPDAAEELGARTLYRAAVAFRRAEDPSLNAKSEELLGRALALAPAEGLALGRRTYSPDELRAEIAREAGRRREGYAAQVSMRYGDPAHAAVGAAGTPFLDAEFRVPMLYHDPAGPDPSGDDARAKEGAEVVRQALRAALAKRDGPAGGAGDALLPGFFPLSAPGTVLYRSYDGVYAVAARDGPGPGNRPTRAGELVWFYPTPGGAQTLFGLPKQGTNPTGPIAWWAQFWQARAPGLVFENSSAGSMSHDGRSVYVVDDLAVPPPGQQTAQNQGQPAAPGGAPGSVEDRIGHGTLLSINLADGKLEWTLGGAAPRPGADPAARPDAEPGDAVAAFEGAFVLGPPVAVEGLLYALVERAGAVRLVCLDPARPAPHPAERNRSVPTLVWSQLIGEAAVPLRADPGRRTQAAYLTYSNGVMLCPTNCGVLVAVDLDARGLLWARYYGAPAPEPGAENGLGAGGFPRRPNFNGNPPAPVPTERWRAAAPMIQGERVVFAAHDSDQLQCLSLRTGELLWRAARKADDLYVAAATPEHVLVVGKSSLRAYALAGDGARGAKQAWAGVATGAPSGHGAAGADGRYYLPVSGSPDAPNKPQVWAVEMATGAIKAKTPYRRPLGPDEDARLVLGNLMFHEGALVSVSPREVAGFALLEPKLREMEARLAKNPADPVGLATRGEIAYDEGENQKAVDDLRAALAAGPDAAVARRARGKLYQALSDLLRADFAGAEKYLPEYEQLAQLPADAPPGDGPEAERQERELARRQSLYHALVALGREGQGRAVEAFESYRRFAAASADRAPAPADGLPGVRVRPRLWARGRVELLLKNAKPADRARILELVSAEYAAARGAPEAGPLSDFAELYAAVLPAGAEARFELARRLLAADSPKAQREATAILLRLGESPDGPAAGRALDLLSASMLARGRAEEAVGLARLARDRAPDAEVRPGKTTAALYADLLSDRRLLPHLEPARPNVSARARVELAAEPTPPQSQPPVQIVPEGELHPLYRRCRLSAEATGANGSLTITLDCPGEPPHRLASNVPRGGAAFDPNARNFGFNGGNAGPSAGPAAVAHGQYVLLTEGHTAYCFDLAERREAWRLDLYGSRPPNLLLSTDIDAAGMAAVQSEDGRSTVVGRAAVVRSGYVCLMTRDGLKCVDPLTGVELWSRAGVSQAARLFGDDEYVFVVGASTPAPAPGGAPGPGATNTLTLRAADGGSVEKAMDFAAKLAGKERLGSVGRRLLLLARSEPKRVELFDPLTREVVWKRALGAGTEVVRSLEPGTVGFLDARAGSFELVEQATGKVVFAAAGAAEELKSQFWRGGEGGADGFSPEQNPAVCFADSERVYLVQTRRPDQNFNRFNAAQAGGLRAVATSGPVFAFDRTTGKRLWYNADSLVNQRLILERQDELPVLVAAATQAVNAAGNSTFRVVALDKRTGLLKLNGTGNPAGDFTHLVIDPRAQTAEFQRADLKLKIGPDDPEASGGGG